MLQNFQFCTHTFISDFEHLNFIEKEGLLFLLKYISFIKVLKKLNSIFFQPCPPANTGDQGAELWRFRHLNALCQRSEQRGRGGQRVSVQSAVHP